MKKEEKQEENIGIVKQLYDAEESPETTLEKMVKAGIEEAPSQVKDGGLRVVDMSLHYSEDRVHSPDNQAKWTLCESFFKSQDNGNYSSIKHLIIGMPLGYFYPHVYHNDLISYE
jgi:hypothetical protein